MGHVDFFGIAPVLFILNYYKVHLFYKELNSLHRSLKITNIFNMKVDHICVGTREIQSPTSRRSWRRWHWQCRPDIWQPRSTSYDRKQTANVGKHGYKVPQLPYLTRQNRPQRYPNRQHLPNISCCVSWYRSWRPPPILEGIPIGKLSKTRKLSIRTNGKFTQNTLPEVCWVLRNVFRNYLVECATALVILP